MRATSIGFALVGALLVSDVAFANQTHYRPVSLAEVVRYSDVLIVHDATPRERTITIAIANAAHPKAPPYTYVETQYIVDEVLKGDATLAKKTIWVKQANWADGLGLHKAYYLEGLGESPIYSQYEPRVKNAAKAKQRIVFVQRAVIDGKPVGLQASVENAVESIDLRGEIMQLAKGAR